MTLAQLVNLIQNLAALFNAINSTSAGPAFQNLLTALEQPQVMQAVTPAISNVVAAAIPAVAIAAKK